MQSVTGVSPRRAHAMAVANIMTSLPLKERLRHPQEIKDEKEAE